MVQLLHPFSFFIIALIGFHFSASPVWIKVFGDIGAVGILLSSMIYRPQIIRVGLERAFVVMLIALCSVVWFAHCPSIAWPDLVSWFVSIGLFYLLVAIIDDLPKLALVEKILWWGFIVFLLAGLVQYGHAILGWKIPLLISLADDAKCLPRLSSLFLARSGINVYAAYLALYMPFFIWQAYCRWQKEPWLRAGVVVAFSLLILNVLMVESRALYIALIGAILIYALRSKMVLKIYAGLGLVVVLAVLFLAPVQKVAASFFDQKDSSNYDHQRTFFYSFELIKKHPIVGWGGNHLKMKLQKDAQGHWRDVARTYKTEAEQKVFYHGQFEDTNIQSARDGVINIHSPHNYYLSFWIEYGVLGLVALLYFFFTVYRLATTDWQRLGLLNFMIYCLFQDSLRAPIMAIFFWIFVLLIVRRKALCQNH